MQAGSIIEKAQKLGLDTSGVNQSEILRHIADQVGVNDLGELEQKLDSMLNENSSENAGNVNEDIENLEDTNSNETNREVRDEKFGQKEYDQAKNEDGVYDKNHYKSKQNELNQKLEDAKKEKKENNKKVGVDENGQNKYKKKNVIDKAKDRRNVSKARQDAITNKLNQAKARAYNMMHPVEAIKDKAKSAVTNAAKNTAKKAGKAVGKATAKGGKALVNVIKKNPMIALIAVGIIFVVFLIIILCGAISASGASDSGYVGLSGYEYIEPKCTQITVKNKDTNSTIGTYDIEEYIAGVLHSEFSYTNEKWAEARKALAIAARSYVLKNANENCEIESSSNRQNFSNNYSEVDLEIVNSVKGLVLTDKNEIKSIQYDAFYVLKKTETFYVIKQKEQEIPADWVNLHVNNRYLNDERPRGHGNGMSQWGAAFLAEQEGYNYKDILDYYYDDFEIKSIYRSFGYSGDYPIDPDNELYANLTKLEDTTLQSALESKGTSIEEFNNILYEKIAAAGIGTKDAIITAAVTLIGQLAELDIRLPYYWGGKYYQTGVSSSWGKYSPSPTKPEYKYLSFDCSGFVNWAITNGMQEYKSENIEYTGRHTQCVPDNLSATTAVCEPGDVLVNDKHIVLVVGIDYENKKYIVAESAGKGVKLSNYKFNAKGYGCREIKALSTIEGSCKDKSKK